MRFFRVAVLSCLAVNVAVSGYAQYGLYGAPETVYLPPPPGSAPADVSLEPAGNAGLTGLAGQPAALATAAYGQEPSPATPLQSASPVLGAGAVPGPSITHPTTAPKDPYAGETCYESLQGNAAPRGDVCGDFCTTGDSGLWFGSLTALVLGRSEGRRLWTSYASNDQTDQLTNTQDVHMPWAWGGQLQVGRQFCGGCQPWAIVGTFWATQSMDGYNSTINSTIAPYTVSTPLETAYLQFNGENAQDWFDGAEEHRLWRNDQFYDAEINLVRMQSACGCGSPWEAGWSAGFRYFRFQEGLTFGSLRNGGTWGQPDNEAYLSDNITNDLFGFQVGFDLAYRFADHAYFFVAPSFGIYDNDMNTFFQAYLGNGAVGTTPYGAFPVRSNRNDVAFLSQIDLGINWQISQHWGALVGYRVIAVTGVAEADDQFPQYIVDQPEIQHIDNHSSLVLYGAFAGVSYNY